MALRIIALIVLGEDKNYTLHSLRSGATQTCQSAGLTLDTIMSAGMWTSNAMNTYLQPIHISSVPAALPQQRSQIAWFKRCWTTP